MDKPYVYVVVRNDIGHAQQVVQSSHAALEAGFRFERPKETASIILLSVPDQAALHAAASRLELHGIEHHLFFEPDFGMGHSALATRPIHAKKERHLMRKYPLLTANREVPHAA
jgi:hypothetical protein